MDTRKTIGRYEIIDELGHGAMGTVYRAKDPAMGRVVALKTISAAALVSQQGTEFRERFFREARAAGGLAHPGIVPMFDVGEHEGMPFLVMELITGQTLADLAKRGERLTLERVCELGQQIAEALGYAHQHGVVHRDIKPANILLTSRETYGIERPKITDFGVAKLAAGQITMTGQMVGTPAFMPPEQFSGMPIDGRADLFSLGVILYWLATGEQAFPGETVTAVSYKVVHTEPVPPRKLNPAIPAKLESIILKCLAKSPADRYQTGEELARDLLGMKTAATVQQTRPQPAVMQGNPEATMDWQPSPAMSQGPIPVQSMAPVQTADVQGQTLARVTQNRSSLLFILAAVVACAIAAGGLYVLRNKGQVAPAAIANVVSAPAPVPTPAPSSPQSPTIRSAAAPAVNPQLPGASSVASPAHNSSAGSNTTSGNSGAVPPSRVPEAVSTRKRAEAEKVDFDPSNLPPNENAKLKIETPRVPPNLNITVEMNGKAYLHWNTSEMKVDDKNLFLPPGIQEFRVTAESGSIQKTSNIVSAEFKAKKRKTLKIEFRNQGKTEKSQSPEGLSETSEIFTSLK